MEISLDHAGIHTFGLADRNKDRAIDAAQLVGDLLVVRRQAGTTIDNENDGISLRQSPARSAEPFRGGCHP